MSIRKNANVKLSSIIDSIHKVTNGKHSTNINIDWFKTDDNRVFWINTANHIENRSIMIDQTLMTENKFMPEIIDIPEDEKEVKEDKQDKQDNIHNGQNEIIRNTTPMNNLNNLNVITFSKLLSNAELFGKWIDIFTQDMGSINKFNNISINEYMCEKISELGNTKDIKSTTSVSKSEILSELMMTDFGNEISNILKQGIITGLNMKCVEITGDEVRVYGKPGMDIDDEYMLIHKDPNG